MADWVKRATQRIKDVTALDAKKLQEITTILREESAATEPTAEASVLVQLAQQEVRRDEQHAVLNKKLDELYALVKTIRRAI